MSHFRQGATTTECLLEIISNQLQLRQRQIEQGQSGGDAQLHEIYKKQIAQLRSKIINQRDELKITVDGV